ncbi:MAG: hypothetical protein P4L84_29550 [Isosphaeraceae bacterium]|nr:hypothetical protein [Isosphaeraceae bacterium]
MRHPRFVGGWIFSARTDALLFGIPFVAGWAILLLHAFIDLKEHRVLNRSIFVIAFACAAYLDTAHLLSTAFKSYLDRNIRRQQAVLLYLTPPLIVAVSVAVYKTLGIRYNLYLFAYFNLYHIVKQQYGWMAFARRKGHEGPGIDFALDRNTLYASMLLPAIWTHLFLEPNERRLPLPTSPTLAMLCVALFLAVVAVYGLRQVWKLIARETINAAKLFIVLSTMATWGAVMFIKSPFLPLIASLYHSVPYLGLVYVSSRGKWFFPKAADSAGPREGRLLCYLLVVLVTGILWSKTLHAFAKVSTDSRLGVSLVILTNVVPIMHYVIDGVVWKRRSYDVLTHT